MPRPASPPRLERNKYGIWEIRWTKDGRSRGRSTGTANDDDAQQILGQFLILRGHQQTDADLTVAAILGDPGQADAQGLRTYWHGHVLKEVVGKDTQKYAIEKLTAHFGAKLPREIDQRDVDDYAVKRRKGEIGRPSGNDTIIRELGVLMAGIKHVATYKGADGKPLIARSDIPELTMPPSQTEPATWLEVEQAAALIRAALRGWKEPNRLPRIYRFVRIGFGTAARQGAIRHLTWPLVDFRGRVIRYDLLPWKKTKKRRVAVRIDDELLPVLERAHKERREDNGYVLDHAGSIRTAFAGAVSRAGLGDDVTPHAMRHSWATWALQRGVSLWDAASTLGDTVETVERTYGHPSAHHLKASSNTVASALGAALSADIGVTDEQQRATKTSTG